MKKSDPAQHTIDKKHSQMLEEFHNNETIHIPQLIAKRQSLKLELRSLNSDQIVQYMELKDKIGSVDDQIKGLKLLKKRYLF